MLVLAGCGGSEAEPKAEKKDAEPTSVTLADLTDEPSVEIVYPTIKIPEGADIQRMDWLIEQLLELTRRSLDVERLSRGSERDAVTWATAPIEGMGDFDIASAFKKDVGTGYSFTVGNRFAQDALPTGPVHVLGQKWESRVREGRVMVRLVVEAAIPFEDGVAVVRRWMALSTGLTSDIATSRPGVQAYFRLLGIDHCALKEEGAARPGDLSEVSDALEMLTERKEEGGLSAWALEDLSDDSSSAPDEPEEPEEECGGKE
ncbi:hypothetical protein [Nocardioides jishulii]|uniref:Uncharacterized protein n=1 Tax=Nocardioides jishulii TaxID=2575440 RepID=A0A4V6X635_9ACTN|nr:hypothetical protein [Nocardioides jishulii]QCX26263.1 hypothetical protein FCL41_00935 [Nocardioides jishulii]TKI63933.1 hypothetical protein FC770_01770 [Nocardioides jishulii]